MEGDDPSDILLVEGVTQACTEDEASILLDDMELDDGPATTARSKKRPMGDWSGDEENVESTESSLSTKRSKCDEQVNLITSTSDLSFKTTTEVKTPLLTSAFSQSGSNLVDTESFKSTSHFDSNVSQSLANSSTFREVGPSTSQVFGTSSVSDTVEQVRSAWTEDFGDQREGRVWLSSHTKGDRFSHSPKAPGYSPRSFNHFQNKQVDKSFEQTKSCEALKTVLDSHKFQYVINPEPNRLAKLMDDELKEVIPVVVMGTPEGSSIWLLFEHLKAFRSVPIAVESTNIFQEFVQAGFKVISGEVKKDIGPMTIAIDKFNVFSKRPTATVNIPFPYVGPRSEELNRPPATGEGETQRTWISSSGTDWRGNKVNNLIDSGAVEDQVQQMQSLQIECVVHNMAANRLNQIHDQSTATGVPFVETEGFRERLQDTIREQVLLNPDEYLKEGKASFYFPPESDNDRYLQNARDKVKVILDTTMKEDAEKAAMEAQEVPTAVNQDQAQPEVVKHPAMIMNPMSAQLERSQVSQVMVRPIQVPPESIALPSVIHVHQPVPNRVSVPVNINSPYLQGPSNIPRQCQVRRFKSSVELTAGYRDGRLGFQRSPVFPASIYRVPVGGHQRIPYSGDGYYRSTRNNIIRPGWSANGYKLSSGGSDPMYQKFLSMPQMKQERWISLGDVPDNTPNYPLQKVHNSHPIFNNWTRAQWKDDHGKRLDSGVESNDFRPWPTVPRTMTSCPGPFFYRDRVTQEEDRNQRWSLKCGVDHSMNHDSKNCPLSIDLRRSILKSEGKCLNCLNYIDKMGERERHVCKNFAPCYHCNAYGHNMIICGSDSHLKYLMRPSIYFSLEQKWQPNAYSRSWNYLSVEATEELRKRYDINFHEQFIKGSGVFDAVREKAYHHDVCITEFDICFMRYGHDYPGQTKNHWIQDPEHWCYLEQIFQTRVEEWRELNPQVPPEDYKEIRYLP